jgi:hypothetical protein
LQQQKKIIAAAAAYCHFAPPKERKMRPIHAISNEPTRIQQIFCAFQQNFALFRVSSFTPKKP